MYQVKRPNIKTKLKVEKLVICLTFHNKYLGDLSLPCTGFEISLSFFKPYEINNNKY
jgi:hypothetical protein